VEISDVVQVVLKSASVQSVGIRKLIREVFPVLNVNVQNAELSWLEASVNKYF